jgi:hypothetical protein
LSGLFYFEAAMICGYGLTSSSMAIEIIRSVCDTLGHGSGAAVHLLAETAAQETHLGKFRDPTPRGAGRGLFQCDLIAFLDVRSRASRRDCYVVLDAYGIEMLSLSHEHLDVSPLAAAIFCRLHYKLIPEPIPETLEGRARYWKKYYNTNLGRGTIEEYVRNAQKFYR